MTGRQDTGAGRRDKRPNQQSPSTAAENIPDDFAHFYPGQQGEEARRNGRGKGQDRGTFQAGQKQRATKRETAAAEQDPAPRGAKIIPRQPVQARGFSHNTQEGQKSPGEHQTASRDQEVPRPPLERKQHRRGLLRIGARALDRPEGLRSLRLDCGCDPALVMHWFDIYSPGVIDVLHGRRFLNAA